MGASNRIEGFQRLLPTVSFRKVNVNMDKNIAQIISSKA